MKPFFTFFFVLLFGITLRLTGQDVPVFTIEEAETTESSSTVSISSVGFSNIASGDLKLVYDTLVTRPSSVAIGKGLGGTLSFNLSKPGVIIIGWFTFPYVTLDDGAEIFNIKFEKIIAGTSPVRFDETAGDMECQFYNGSYQKLDDSPFSTFYKSGSLVFNEKVSPVTTAPNLTATENENIDVPVTVKDFKHIGAVSLRLGYDSDVLSYNAANNTGGFPNLIIYNPAPGTITVSGTTGSAEGYSLPDSSVFFTLNITYHGGTSGLSWFDDDGTSCEYAGPQSAFKLNDTPQSTFYINGSVRSDQKTPAINIEETDNPATCGGNGLISLSFTHVPDGTYTIDFDGDSFSNVAVSEGSATISTLAGIYNNLQITINDISSASGIHAILTDPEPPNQPVITANGPTVFCEGDSLILTSSEAVYYKWSTGENTQSITVSSSGNYYVMVTNAKACSASSETVEVTVDPRPKEPEKINCWDEYVFNNTTCLWENVGTEPLELAPVNCWDKFTFNTNTCEWENIGTPPEEPVVACYQSATWNKTTCNWDVTGTRPETPSTECWETTTWNETTCSWEVTGVQPAMPTPVFCWDDYRFNETICLWENVGTKPLVPSPVNEWDEFIFDQDSCAWINIGIATNVEIQRHADENIMIFYPNPFSQKATIKYLLPKNGQVYIYATNMLGNRLTLLNNRHQPAGNYFLNIDGDILVAGIYQITLEFSNLDGYEIISTVRIIKR